MKLSERLALFAQGVAADFKKLGTFAFARQSAYPAFSVMPDSGRFAGDVDPLALTFATPFSPSPMLATFNGSVITDAGKFSHNNATGGGSAPALAEPVISLLAAMGRAGDEARYGVEFYVMRATAGEGTDGGVTVGRDGVSRSLVLANGSQAIYQAESWATFVAWVRVTSGSIHCQAERFQNGEPVDFGVPILPEDGWVHIRVIQQSPRGYNYSFPSIFAAPGTVVELACAAVFNGLVDPGVHKAPIATTPAGSNFGRSLIAGAGAADARAKLELVKQSYPTEATADRVLVNGSWGMGTRTAPAANANANNVVTTGVYARDPATQGAGSNWPNETAYGPVKVTSSAPGFAEQVLRDLSTAAGTVYSRKCRGGVWDATWAAEIDPMNPRVSTPAADVNDTSIATTAFVRSAMGLFGVGSRHTVTDADLAPTGLSILNLSAATNVPAGQLGGVGWLETDAELSYTGSKVQRLQTTSPVRTFIRTVGVTDWQELWHTGNLVKQTSSTDTTAGALMAVGAFGWNGGPALGLGASVDADTLETPGLYLCGSGGVNLPMPQMYPYVWVTAASASDGSSQIKQLAFAVNSDRMAVRTRFNGVWSSWVDFSSVGVGQRWQNATGSRAIGTTYTNTTGKTIAIAITAVQGSGGAAQLVVQDIGVTEFNAAAIGDVMVGFAIVPPGATYYYGQFNGTSAIRRWMELR